MTPPVAGLRTSSLPYAQIAKSQALAKPPMVATAAHPGRTEQTHMTVVAHPALG